MAQVVCIRTARRDLCEIFDIVSVHNDDVRLTGKGYANFIIVKVAGKKVEEFRKGLKYPEIKIDKRTGIESWLADDGKWYELKVTPKYSHSMKELTETDKIALADENTLDKDRILSKIVEKISLIAENKDTEVKEVIKAGV